MGRITFKAGNEYAIKISRLVARSDYIAKKAIYEGAKIVTDRIRKEMNTKLSGESTGDMAESLGITPMDRDDYGDWNVKVGFDGYDSKGTPNQLKARALESGTSTIKKRPFVRPAMYASKKRAQEAMAKVIDEEIRNLGF